MYRPKDWDRQILELLNRMPISNSAEGKVFGMNCLEAGADAMLEALRKEGMPISHIERWQDIKTQMEKFNISPAIGNAIGWLVFIPDKEESNGKSLTNHS